ncbi:hypothetical protein AADW59_00795 [Candidatus Hodgkinia cicadicola]
MLGAFKSFRAMVINKMAETSDYNDNYESDGDDDSEDSDGDDDSEHDDYSDSEDSDGDDDSAPTTTRTQVEDTLLAEDPDTAEEDTDEQDLQTAGDAIITILALVTRMRIGYVP